jgi:hypothetical protein
VRWDWAGVPFADGFWQKDVGQKDGKTVRVDEIKTVFHGAIFECFC